MTWFEGFEAEDWPLDGITLHLRQGGRAGAPPLLLLHGYPQTHAIWHRVARLLHERYWLVMPDLRGYGRSAKPAGGGDHAPYSKRAMAADMAALMSALGHERFFVAGHDRGGRVAHRLALDHAPRVQRLMLLDISPTLTMYEGTTMDFARSYYHWFHLIQPYPLPERHIGADPIWHLHFTLSGAGAKSLDHFEAEAMAEYEAAFSRTETIHATCEDYRAAAGIDLEHDRASLAAGQRLACPVRVLWGAAGVVNRLFDPLRDWAAVSDAPVSGCSLPCGHYLPEECPGRTAEELDRFFTA